MRCRPRHLILFVEEAWDGGAAVLCIRCKKRFDIPEDSLIEAYTHLHHTNGRIGPAGDFDIFLADELLRGT